MRRLKLVLVLVAGALALAAALELAGRWVLTKKVGAWAVEGPEEPDDGPDPLLGWSGDQKNTTKDKYGPGRDKTYNSKGMRATEEFSVEAAPGVYRVVCLGDTFTFGAGLGDHETYPEQMERLRPDLQTVNMAMGAYGVGQGILWYEKDGRPLEHDVVLIAFTDDAYERMPAAAFLWVMPKPRFVLDEDGALELTNVPVPSWGRRGYWRDFPRSTAAYKVIHRLIDERFVQDGYDSLAVARQLYARVRDDARAKGRTPVLVHLPTTRQLHARCPSGEGFCKTEDRPQLAVQLEAMAGALGIPFVDVTPAFRRVQDAGGIDPYFQPDQTYSAAGHVLVAEHLVGALTRLVPGFPEAEAAADAVDVEAAAP